MTQNTRQYSIEAKTIFISCIVPVFNEEEVIEAFVTKLISVLQTITNQFEIIIVDDGSRDATIAKVRGLENSYIKLLGLSRNFGKEIALTAGIDHAKGDVIILIDADFQHPPELIPKFLEYWRQGYDMVYGIRDRESESYLKRHMTQFFYWMMQKITVVDLPNNAGDFRLMDKKVIDALKEFPERTRFMKGLYAWVGFKKIGLHFQVKDRIAGKSSWGLLHLTELAITAITSFSDVPLRIWSFIGFIISFISLIYAIYIITITLLYGADLPGFPTLAVAIMFFGGIQLLSIGILGEYIARIFTEVKQRPRYLIRIKEGFNE